MTTALLAVIAVFVLVQPVTSGLGTIANISNIAHNINKDHRDWLLQGCPKRYFSDEKIHYTCGAPPKSSPTK